MEFIIRNRKGLEFRVLYDAEDQGLVNAHTWHVTSAKFPYVRTTINSGEGKRNVLFHRAVLGIIGKARFTDHINGNSLDNRRANLRECSNAQNGRNKKGFGASKFLGVCRSTGRNKWQATIKADGKYRMLGRFDTEIEAAKAYDSAARIAHGEFANLNFKI